MRVNPTAVPLTHDHPFAFLHSQAREIFAHALKAASIPAAFDSRLRFEDGAMVRQVAKNLPPITIPLDKYKKVYVIAVGKAALPMLDTLLARMPRKAAVRGVCCAPSLPPLRHRNIHYYAGGHPSPNPDSFHAARAALRLLHRADANTFVFFLISGGGSSLFEAPLDKRISLEDTIAFHRALVGSGAAIAEINTVRKHFSAVKGGRLAAAAPDAAKFTLLLSDVPAHHLDALASGPTLPDRSTVEECREIIDRYQMFDQFPARVRAFFSNPALPETPGTKAARPPAASGSSIKEEQPQDGLGEIFEVERPEFAHSQVDLLLSNRDLLNAARDYAQDHGWHVAIDNTCDDWDYREAARYLLKRFEQLRREHPRLCLLSGGEVTVRLDKSPGTGGRNQQLALACALELAGIAEPRPESSTFAASGKPIAILSAGSDGIDGLSPAAGAIADPTTVARARAYGLDPAGALRRFDSYPIFTALGDSIITGPTNNNLRDLRILLSC